MQIAFSSAISEFSDNLGILKAFVSISPLDHPLNKLALPLFRIYLNFFLVACRLVRHHLWYEFHHLFKPGLFHLLLHSNNLFFLNLLARQYLGG